jgi:MoaA/NifB/PqqE/SkfB family radical SAM enzyme
MYLGQDIKILHMETTSECNATCPMCLRSVSGGAINPQLPITELTLSEVQKALPVSFVKGLNKVYMCGNYGDPAAASESLEIFEWLRSVHPDIQLEIFSNGGLRNPTYWQKLAGVVDRAVFAIDGLEDTNHLYRKGVVWSKVEANLKAFLQAGGNARWDYIVFRHNEHQVEYARHLAEIWGVQKFQVKKTGRFFSNSKSARKDEQIVMNKQGEVEYTLQMPRGEKYINSALLSEKAKQSRVKESKAVAFDKSGEAAKNSSTSVPNASSKAEVAPEAEPKPTKSMPLGDYIEKAPIDCKVAQEKSIYLTAEGFALPCCWLAIRMYPWYLKPKSGELWQMFETLDRGLDSLNAIEHGIDKVIGSAFFQKRLPESWSKPSYKDGKLFACAKTCGRKDFDLFTAQFANA